MAPPTPRPRRPDRRAVIVGVAQLRRKPGLDGPWEPVEPARLMATAILAAAADAGDARLVAEADTLACVDPIAWGYDALTSHGRRHGRHDRSGLAPAPRGADRAAGRQLPVRPAQPGGHPHRRG